MSAHLLKGIRPYNEESTDLLIVDGVIAALGAEAAQQAANYSDLKEHDFTGLVALPGLVDIHTHLREPGREDSETVYSGTRAAAAGGYTAVFAMANTTPVADNAGVVEQVLNLGRQAGWVDVHPVGAVSAGLEGKHLSEMGAMAASKARVRVFSDDGKCVSDPMLMRRALEYVKAFDGVIAQHSQDPRLTENSQMHEGKVSAELGLRGWPAVAEESIIARDVLLTEHVGSRLHVCHLSTAGSVEIVRLAKARGINVTAEVTPHHLLLTDELARTYSPLYKVNPIETMVKTGKLDWRGVARVMSQTPARIGRLEDQGGDIAVGQQANLAIIDPNVTRVVDGASQLTASDNTPYAGMELPGQVIATFLHGAPTVLGGVPVPVSER